jgi:hypothetical protein
MKDLGKIRHPHAEKMKFFFFLFFFYMILRFELRACPLQLEPFPQPFFALAIFQIGSYFLPKVGLEP